MNISVTPFDGLVAGLERKHLVMLKNDISIPPLFVQVHTIGEILKVLYLKLNENIESLEISARIYLSVLNFFNYIQFINQTPNILDKVIGPDFDKTSFPEYQKINFYRDKVVEHWTDYVDRFPSSSIIKAKDSITIPVIFQGHDSQNNRLIDRTHIAEIIQDRFANINFKLEIPQEYIDSVYLGDTEYTRWFWNLIIESGLINYKTNSNKKVKTDKDILIENLMKFGFAPPFNDVKKYSEDLSNYLEGFV